MQKLTTLDILRKKGKEKIHMLTCYDYPTAKMFNQSNLDLILVGDSLGNVMLGYETTIPVTLSEMQIFARSVRKGAPDKFMIVDAPFGSYLTFTQGVHLLSLLFKNTQAEAIKLEGAELHHCKIIERLVQSGVPVMGHIGLKPQSVHAQGGYRKHGKNDPEAKKLLKEARDLAHTGAFAIVLECVKEEVAQEISQSISIPTIGIGSGHGVDGQVLVWHDLVGLLPGKPPSFVKPISNLFEQNLALLQKYLAT